MWGNSNFEVKLLIVLQYPFADMRAFSDMKNGRTVKPNWSRSTLQGFVRGFGEIESRYHRLKKTELRILYKREKVEKHYVNCTKRVYPRINCEKLPDPWSKCLHVFSRLISDGRLSFRLEIGIHVDATSVPTHADLHGLLLFILKSRIVFRDRKTENKKTYETLDVGQAANTATRIRQRIQEKTTLHSFGSEGNSIPTDFLDFLGLLVFADFSSYKIDESILAESQLLPSESRGFDLAFYDDEILKQPLGVWVMGNQAEPPEHEKASLHDFYDKQRRVRLHILRFSSELRAIEVVLSAANAGLLKFTEGHSSLEAFEGAIRASLDRLVETGNETARDLVELEIGQLANAEALFDVVDKIDENLQQLNFSKPELLSDRLKHLPESVRNIVVVTNPKNTLDINIENTGGDKVAGNQIKGNRGGIIAHTVKAKKIVVTTSWNEFDPNGEVDREKLAEELSKLKIAMFEEVSSEEELEELSSVQKAELAAKKGEGSKVLEHLSNAGKWTLSIAEKIVVPVAVTVLKKLAGV